MTYTTTMAARAAWLGALVALAGCSIVTPDHYIGLQDDRPDGAVPEDGEVTEPDAGGPQFDDICRPPEEMPRRLLTETTRNIEIDTTEGYDNDNSSSCGATTPGNDVFIGIDVTAGAVWHFHLAGLTPGREPMLYLTEASRCDSRTCSFVSTSCTGGSDEHFAFEANANGRWYIGIDDGAAGGGRYRLEAYRLVCGDGTESHGEGCDDSNVLGGDGCDRKCRIELSTLRTAEFEPNDNRVEANAILLPAENELEITGDIGGTGACTYADVFAVTVPEMGDLEIDALNDDGTPCAVGASTMFDLVLQNGSGETVVSGMRDGNGCAIMHRANLASGEYFVRVQVPAETTVPEQYRLRFRVLP
jgi:cysteine-rich repeat protein